MTAPARICEHPKCKRIIRRKARTGPWPRWCPKHKREHEAEMYRTVWRRPRKTGAPVMCHDCPAAIEIPAHGKTPERCPDCRAAHRRRMTAERQRRHRARAIEKAS